MRPKVSVVIPVYNVEAYIERCARSLFEQTLDSLEYIFVNDCTPDNSMQILQKVLTDYPHRKNQVVIIDQPQNWGAAKAREDGVKTATGEYIIHCDSDDWVDRDMYRLMYEKAISEELDIVICDWVETNGKNSIIIQQKLNTDKDLLAGLIDRSMSGSLCNKLIACYIYDKIEVYPTEHMMEDVAYLVQLLFFCKKIGYLSKPFYYYYSNDNSICKKPGEEISIKRYKQACSNVDIVLSFLTNHHIEARYKDEVIILKNYPRIFIWNLVLSQPSRYYQLWHDTYPEINWRYPFNKRIDWRLRAFFFLMLIRVYPVVYKLKGC